MKDALAFGGACISLLNHADRVRCACLAQLVNAIAPIMTETGGPAWRQTIFHPFAHFSNFGRGRVLRAEVASPTYSATYHDPRGTADLAFPLPEVPYVKLAAVHDEAGGAVTLFVLNRHLEQPISIDIDIRGFGALELKDALELRNDDLSAANTKEAPERVRPGALAGVRVGGGQLLATLTPASWNVIRLAVSQ
jgi:alpha-N-arabinofuranosidase